MAAKVKTLDFSGVKDGGGNFRPRRRKEGDYYAHIVAVADHESREKNPGWVFTIKVDGDARATYPYYCNFEANQLWKSRGLCIAAGLKVPSAKVKMDPNKLVGKAIGIALVDDEYEGRVKSVIDGVFPIDELSDAMNEPSSASTKAKSHKAEEDDDDEDDDEDEEPVPVKKSKKRQPEPDDDDDDDDEEEDEEPPAKKSKATKKKRTPVEDDDDEDDDEDEPPAKSKKSAPAKKGKSKKARDEDDDDEELDLDDL